MANIKSNEKSHRADVKRNKRNHAQLSKMKTLLKKSKLNLNDNQKYLDAVSTVDKTAQKGVIHKNKSNRIKSRLAKKQNSIQA